jgi:glycerol-3-phosphate acyltransferase PlsY
MYYAFVGLGYALGSIPFGLIFTHLCGRGDIRAIGSGNIGATNVLRTGNKTLAALTLLCDFLKGFIPVWLAMENNPTWGIPVCTAAILGHVFPLWLRFKGGKGVATALGSYMALSPYVGGFVALAWLITAKVCRISSLSALVAFSLTPVALWLYQTYGGAATLPAGMVTYTAAVALFIAFTHRSNIQRLIHGDER